MPYADPDVRNAHARQRWREAHPRPERVCARVGCGVSFGADKRPDAVFCSTACSMRAAYDARTPHIVRSGRLCGWCGVSIDHRDPKAKFCCPRCATFKRTYPALTADDMRNRQCDECGAPLADSAQYGTRWCSDACCSRNHRRTLSPEVKRHRHLLRYGISYDELVEIVAGQDGMCGNRLCRRQITALTCDVDHDGDLPCEAHQVNGALCFNCNVARGHLRNDSEVMRGLMEREVHLAHGLRPLLNSTRGELEAA